MASRPLATALPGDASRLLEQPDLERLRLPPLAREGIAGLVCQRLGVDHLPEPVLDLLLERAEGNPFFSEELACALRDLGLIQIEGRGCRLVSAPEALRSLHFPHTVQGVITSRIDRLTPQLQLTLKVASVIGRVFSHRTLTDIHPVVEDRRHLGSCLEALAQLDLTPLEAWERELETGRPDPALRRSARRACEALSRFCRAFPVGLPAARRCQGRLLRLSGRRRATVAALHRGLDAAIRLGMRYEEARVRLELSRLESGWERRAQQDLAEALLAALRCGEGTVWQGPDEANAGELPLSRAV